MKEPVFEPVLVTRWRLSGGKLPLFGRHMRALSARTISGNVPSPEFLGWVKQHIEWTLQPASQAQKDGVLMLVVDRDGKAAMSLGPFEPLVRKEKDASQNAPLAALLLRAAQAQNEAEQTNVAPEILWAVQATEKTSDRNRSVLLVGAKEDASLSGANSLLVDLAKTKGYEIQFTPHLLEKLKRKIEGRKNATDSNKEEREAGGNRKETKEKERYQEIFLVSDEQGVVVGKGGPVSTFFSEGYQKLLDHIAEK